MSGHFIVYGCVAVAVVPMAAVAEAMPVDEAATLTRPPRTHAFDAANPATLVVIAPAPRPNAAIVMPTTGPPFALKAPVVSIATP